MESSCLEFTAIRGVQAGAAYYVIMCPLKQLPRLVSADDEDLPPELRAQRVVNAARVPAIARYIHANPREYVLPSLCASVDGEMTFVAAGAEGPLRSVGRLRIGLSANILINDGQHRRAALEEVLKECPTMGDETVSIVIYADRGLRRSQQMFADLNAHAVRPTKSLRLLYDHRDGMAELVRHVIESIPLFRDFTALDASSVPSRSMKLFTLSGLHQATAELLGKPMTGTPGTVDAEVACRFWTAVIAQMPDWQAVARHDAIAAELRRDYVHAHAVTIHAIGVAGRSLLECHASDWEGRLKSLREVDWSRANRKLWEGRALVGGKVNKSRTNVLLISNVLLRAMGAALTAEGGRVELAHAAAHAPAHSDPALRAGVA